MRRRLRMWRERPLPDARGYSFRHEYRKKILHARIRSQVSQNLLIQQRDLFNRLPRYIRNVLDVLQVT
jgi:hypothetical protein